MKIYKEGTTGFLQYNSDEFIGTVHYSDVGFEQIAGDTKIRISLDLVSRRGEADIVEDILYADCKNLAGTAHAATYLAIITAIFA